MSIVLKTYNIKFVIAFAMIMIFGGCTEPFTPEIPIQESILVIEARVTNKQENHEVILSRSGQEGDVQIPERGATVSVLGSDQQQYTFSETQAGIYVSNLSFAASPGVSYQLLITTTDGSTYQSDETLLPASSQIDRVYAQRSTTDSGLEGVSLLVDSFNPNGDALYYKYEFEETYKIIAPNWGPDQLVVLSEENRVLGIIARTEEERICYNTDFSNEIILTNTSAAGEDRISNFTVRFINRDNFIISHRYSILVKQYVLSQGAFNYYEKLSEFSGSSSLFSESQPGFINGNIKSESNPDEKVIGFFEVASVSERRAFFNYTELFPGEELPPFIDECRRTNFLADGTSSIFDLVQANAVSYVNNVTDPFTGELLEYIVVPRACGDCNELGSNVIPDFWEE